MGCADGKVKTCLSTSPSDLPAKAPRCWEQPLPTGTQQIWGHANPAGVWGEDWAVPAGPPAAPGPCPPSLLVPRRRAGPGTAPHTPGTGQCGWTGCAGPAKGTAMHSTGDNQPAGGGRISSSSRALGHIRLPRAAAADMVLPGETPFTREPGQDTSQPLPLWPVPQEPHSTRNTSKQHKLKAKRGPEPSPGDASCLPVPEFLLGTPS